MVTLLTTILTTICGSLLTLIIFSSVTLLTNLPGITMTVQKVLQSITLGTVSVFRIIFGSLALNSVARLLIPIITSLLICAVIVHFAVGRLIGWPFIIALVYGISVGISWAGGFQTDRFQFGVDL
jgi:hypothetical protein